MQNYNMTISILLIIIIIMHKISLFILIQYKTLFSQIILINKAIAF